MQSYSEDIVNTLETANHITCGTVMTANCQNQACHPFEHNIAKTLIPSIFDPGPEWSCSALRASPPSCSRLKVSLAYTIMATTRHHAIHRSSAMDPFSTTSKWLKLGSLTIPRHLLTCRSWKDTVHSEHMFLIQRRNRPTRFPLDKVQHAYDQLPGSLRNNTLLQRFLKDHFAPVGSELVELADWSFTTNATFIASIHNPIIEEFVQKITGKWANLTRIFNESVICDKCESSFIPIKRPFVIAGGRFREPYCWDSYWILQGLLRTGGNFTQISRNQIENFLDNVEQYGFVPNGGRKYYLNRSQPPMLPQMMRIYIEYTGDHSILDRGLPLLMKEHEFFARNRSVALRVANSTYALNRLVLMRASPRVSNLSWLS